MIRFNDTPWMSNPPNEAQLKQLNIAQLLNIAQTKKKRLKPLLIEHILKQGKL